jgi:hypothetical protein
MRRLCKVVSKKFAQAVTCVTGLLLRAEYLYPARARSCLTMKGDNMRSRITQFAIRTVVAIGIAFVGATAFGMVVAHSAFERAQVSAQETLSKPFRSGPKTEFRLGEHQQLRKIFLNQ